MFDWKNHKVNGRDSSKIDLAEMSPSLTGLGEKDLMVVWSMPKENVLAAADKNVYKRNLVQLDGQVSHGICTLLDQSQPWPQKFKTKSRVSMRVDGVLFMGWSYLMSGFLANAQPRARAVIMSIQS